jgi:hypothetical protein
MCRVLVGQYNFVYIGRDASPTHFGLIVTAVIAGVQKQRLYGQWCQQLPKMRPKPYGRA